MFNKRGQEGVTLGTLILLILGAVALIVIVLGFTMGWSFIFSKIGILPGQSLQALAESCKISAGSDLAIDYCGYKYIQVEGEDQKQWINCEYPEVLAELNRLGVSRIDCAAYTLAGKCNEVKIETEKKKATFQPEKVYVNGKPCSEILSTTAPATPAASAKKASGDTCTLKEQCQSNDCVGGFCR